MADGVLVPIHRGVYRHAATAPSWKTRLHGAVLASGEGALASHRSAARLHGLRDVPLYRPEVTVVGTMKPRHDALHVHRAKTIDPLDRAVVDSIPVTGSALTLLNLGAVLPFEVVALATQDAIIRNVVSTLDLVCVLERAGGRGKPGTAALRAIVDSALPSDVLESRLEADFERLIKTMAVPAPQWQYSFTCDDGLDVRFDAAWPDIKVAAEVDGRLWHSTKKDFEADMARRRSIMLSGWALYSFGYTDVRQRPHVVRSTLEPVVGRLSS
jgi:hypothetical protein